MNKTLEYYFDDGVYVKFNKYTIDIWGVVRNKNSGKLVNTCKDGKYRIVSVYDDKGKRRKILIGRAIASTFRGKPPTPYHTADHIDRDPDNDTFENIRWFGKKEQVGNRTMPETHKYSFIIIKDGIQKTVKEWVDHLRYHKNHMGRDYTEGMIAQYAVRKQHDFSYKEYPDLPGEVWKEIVGSKTVKGRWEISNMNRVKWITTHAENVISGERFGMTCGYPSIRINGKKWLCHILAFAAFFPEEYTNKKQNEFVLHESDNRLDFRPCKLRLGSPSENTIDAHTNGSYDGKMSARMGCTSYINGIFEKEYESQSDAMIYLKSIGYDKASQGKISQALGGQRKTAYGRTWMKI
jgi:hypothetical protein